MTAHITEEDYRRALAGFVADMEGLGPDVICVLLYGSLARGDIRPGRSDLLDGVVVLADGVMEERERLGRVLLAMVESCRKLASVGVPFQPFHYCSAGELGLTPAMFAPIWASRRSSKVLLGDDCRGRMTPTAGSLAAARNAFFRARRAAQALSRFSTPSQLSERERRSLEERLIAFRKNILQAALMAAGELTAPEDVMARMKEAVPGVDLSVIDGIDALRSSPSGAVAAETLAALAGALVHLVEELNRAVLASGKYPQEV
jgi:hypothetical protein